MTDVKVIGGEISEAEKQVYVERVRQKNPTASLERLEIKLDGDHVELRWEFAPVPFERLRRITGYLVGSMDHWNDAKRAEEHDRVKHDVSRR